MTSKSVWLGARGDSGDAVPLPGRARGSRLMLGLSPMPPPPFRGLSPVAGVADRPPQTVSGRPAGLTAHSGEQLPQLPPDPGRGDGVEVIARADDLTVAYPHHEDRGQRVRLPALRVGPLILELGHDDLRIGRLVNDDIANPAARPRPLAGVGRPGARAQPEVLPDLLPAARRRGAQRIERVDDVGLLGVEIGQLLKAPVGHAVSEREEDLSRGARRAWRAGLVHGSLLSSARYPAGPSSIRSNDSE